MLFKSLFLVATTALLSLPQALCGSVEKRLTTGKHYPQGGVASIEYTEGYTHYIKNYFVRASDGAIMESSWQTGGSGWSVAAIQPPTYADRDSGLAAVTFFLGERRQIEIFYQNPTLKLKAVKKDGENKWLWDDMYNWILCCVSEIWRPTSAILRDGRPMVFFVIREKSSIVTARWGESGWTTTGYKFLDIGNSCSDCDLGASATAVAWNDGAEISLFYFTTGYMTAAYGLWKPGDSWFLREARWSKSTGKVTYIEHADTHGTWSNYSPQDQPGSIAAVLWEDGSNIDLGTMKTTTLVSIRLYVWGHNLWEISFNRGTNTAEAGYWSTGWKMPSHASGDANRYAQISAVHWQYPGDNGYDHIRLFQVKCSSSSCDSPRIAETSYDSTPGWRAGAFVT